MLKSQERYGTLERAGWFAAGFLTILAGAIVVKQVK
jgi:hypothetical protein